LRGGERILGMGFRGTSYSNKGRGEKKKKSRRKKKERNQKGPSRTGRASISLSKLWKLVRNMKIWNNIATKEGKKEQDSGAKDSLKGYIVQTKQRMKGGALKMKGKEIKQTWVKGDSSREFFLFSNKRRE